MSAEMALETVLRDSTVSRWAARVTLDVPRVQKLFSTWLSAKRAGARSATARTPRGNRAEVAVEVEENEDAEASRAEVEQDHDDDDDDDLVMLQAAAPSGPATSGSSSHGMPRMTLDLTLDEVLRDEDAGAGSGDDA